jgi:glucose/arabinose dehydrogenase
VARGRLVGTALQNVQVLLRQQPKVAGDNHFGARLAFASDKTLYVTLGDRQQDDPANPGMAWAQNPAVQQGKVLRMARDGSGLQQVSLGHRNPQGAAVHPSTGELWLVEHCPQGGDELNRVRSGRNYGWPLRSYGCPYGSPVGEACRVGGARHAPEFEEPVATWVPTSIAPADLQFARSPLFPEWQGDALIPALAGTALWRVSLGGSAEAPRETGRERLLGELGERLRCLRQGPDGAFYLLTDSGRLLRLSRR